MCRCLPISRSYSWPGFTCRRRWSLGFRTWRSSWDKPMPALIDTIEGKKIAGHRPCPRLVVNEDGWRFAASQLSAGYWTLLGLWGDTDAVHMAVLDEGAREIAVVTLPCPDGHFPSVGALHPPAIRLERAVHDLYGFEPIGSPDRPSTLAVVRLMTRSNLVGCSTGMSAGFAPRRILSTLVGGAPE